MKVVARFAAFVAILSALVQVSSGPAAAVPLLAPAPLAQFSSVSVPAARP